MVIVNDIEFQLVLAESKVPFKEHQKDPNTFVEVEPDAEYYISVRRVGLAFEGDLCCVFEVDGKDVGHSFSSDHRDGISEDFTFLGTYSISNGLKHDTALRFVDVPVEIADDSPSSAINGMGKITLNVYELPDDAFYWEKAPRDCDYFSKNPPQLTVEKDAFVTKKKNVRTIQGDHRLAVPKDSCSKSGGQRFFDLDKLNNLLYSKTLYYCATPALITVGVLPKPPLWDQHRQSFPEKLNVNEEQELEKIVIISETRNRRGNLIIELGGEDDGDGDDGKIKTNNKKFKTNGNGNRVVIPPTPPRPKLW